MATFRLIIVRADFIEVGHVLAYFITDSRVFLKLILSQRHVINIIIWKIEVSFCKKSPTPVYGQHVISCNRYLTGSWIMPIGPSFVLRRRLQDFRYVRILFLARSWNSGNWRSHASKIAWTLSFGCFEIGIDRSRFSSINRRTNNWNQ